MYYFILYIKFELFLDIIFDCEYIKFKIYFIKVLFYNYFYTSA